MRPAIVSSGGEGSRPLFPPQPVSQNNLAAGVARTLIRSSDLCKKKHAVSRLDAALGRASGHRCAAPA